MPCHKTHLFGGGAAYILLMMPLARLCPSPAVGVEWFFFALAGSLFPDVDIKSRGQRYFYLLVLASLIILYTEQRHALLAATSIATLTPLLVKHRGVFHRWWFLAFICALMWYAGSSVNATFGTTIGFDALFFFAGALSHLLLDFGPNRALRFR